MINDVLGSFLKSCTYRVKNPICGAFLLSWSLVHWNDLTVLFWGNEKIEERVEIFCAALTENWLLLGLLLPLAISVFYLFIVPWVSFYVLKFQDAIIEKRYNQNIDLKIREAEKRTELTRSECYEKEEERLVQAEIDKKLKIDSAATETKLIENDKARSEARRLQYKADAEQAEAEKAQSEAERVEALRRTAEAEAKIKEAEEELTRNQLKRQEVTLSCDRLRQISPIYRFQRNLSLALIRESQACLSLADLEKLTCLIWGMDDFDEIIDRGDEFDQYLKEVHYVFWDKSKMKAFCDGMELSRIDIDIEKLKGDTLQYGMFCMSREDITVYVLEKLIPQESVNSHRSVVAARSATNAGSFSEPSFVNDILTNDNSGMVVLFKGISSGYQLATETYQGDKIEISVKFTFPLLLGRNGYGDYKCEVSAKRIGFDDV